MRKGGVRTRLVLGLLAGSLAGCTGEHGGGIDWGSLAPEAGWECTTADAWQVRGFDYDHFATAQPGELLVATLRRGDVVALELTNRFSSQCGSRVAAVQWLSALPDVAAVTARGPLGADLEAVAPGETLVSAEVTLSDGSRRTAELFSVPTQGSPLLRVYVVRVIR